MKNSELKLEKISRTKLAFKILEECKNGLFFGVVFTKKDGSERTMLARKGVKIGVNGKGQRYNAISKGLLPVFDVHKSQHRTINLDTIKSCNINGKKYKVI